MSTVVQDFVGRFTRREVPVQVVAEDNADNAAEIYFYKSGLYNMSTQELAPGFRITADDTVVDVGCGPGSACLFAARQGADVVGVDIDPSETEKFKQRLRDEQERLNAARKAQEDTDGTEQIELGSVRALTSDCNPIPLPADHATRVVAMEVLEHVDDPAAFLAELVRIGRPGARYLVTVPDPLCESVQREIAPGTYWSKPNHIRVFERDVFQQVVEAAGLVVERRFSFGFYWSMWWSLYWAVPKNGILPGQSGDSAILRNWNRTCKALLSTPEGERVWRALENALPKSQAIIARKPANNA